MEQYISKAAVVAEIENRIKELQNLWEENKAKLDSIQKTAILLCIDECKVIPNPMIHLSANPLWPWEFGNCQLAESTDGMENLKPVKATSSPSCKVDNIQMLLSALILHDQLDTK